MDSQHQDAEMMLMRYIYDYLLKRNLHTTAQTFKNEVNILDEPMEILDESHSNFLLDWWSIFSDLYFQKQSSGESQETIQKEFLLEPFNRSNKQDSWLQALIMHPNMTPQGASLLQSNNSILRYFPLTRNQENERQCTPIHQFANRDEIGVQQPNFFRDMQQDIRSRSTPPYHLGQAQHLNIDGPPQMGLKRARLVTSLPMELYGQDKLIDWPYSGIDPTFTSVRQRGINPPSVCSNQVPQLHSFTWQQEQLTAQRSHAYVMDNSNNMDIPSLLDNNFNKSINQIGSSSVQREIVMTMAEESTRKGKEPLYSSIKDNSQSGDVVGPCGVTPLTPISTSCDAPTSGTNIESFGIAEKMNMDNFEEDNEDISKLLNELETEQVKENSGNSVESQSFPEGGGGDNYVKAQPLSIEKKVSSNVNKEYIKDQ